MEINDKAGDATPDTDTALMPGSLSIMGIKVVPFASYSQAVGCVADRIRFKKKSFCVAINPEKVYRAGQDQKLKAVLDRADFGICDGVGVSIAAGVLYGHRIPRCTGVDLFLKLIEQASKADWKIFLLGASPEVNETACQKLQERYPTLKIVGHQNGYFKDNATVIEQINSSGADMLFVAMGSPRQEFWISENRAAIEASFCMGVGGTLDVVSGNIKRAPRFFRQTGTEFLYRLISEPKRWRRQTALPLFMFSVLRKKIEMRIGINTQK
jgi:N-acetylglucosaminyldiphosphoundecaprenol N-acetyl-beta-D-mannosaminyltransferase